MRILEIISIVLVFITIVSRSWQRRSKSSRRPGVWQVSAWLTVISTGLHLLLDGYRWQMVPLYLLVAFILAGALWGALRPRRQQARPTHVRAGFLILELLLFLPAAALPALLPVPNLPRPTGPYPIGTSIMETVDSSRDELYSPQAGPRRLMAQVWYPADLTDGVHREIWPGQMGTLGPYIADWLDLPFFFFDHLVYATTNAVIDAPIKGGGNIFPLVLFSHGWGGFRSQNTFQMEELASHGYVVVAVDHTYGAVATLFPDGELARINPQALPFDLPADEFLPAANRLVKQWQGDLSFILDTIETSRPQAPFGFLSGKVNTARVAVLGHSTGGGAAIEFCQHDPRCFTGLAMDPYVLPVPQDDLDNGLQHPFFFMFSQLWPKEPNLERFKRLIQHSSEDMYQMIVIQGTDHYDFTDLPALSPIAPQLGLKGPLAGERVQRIVLDYTLATLDAAFEKSSPESLSQLSERYSEVSAGQFPRANQP